MTTRRKTQVIITLDVLTAFGADIPAGADRKFVDAFESATRLSAPVIERAIEKQYNGEFPLDTQFRVVAVALDESSEVYSDPAD